MMAAQTGNEIGFENSERIAGIEINPKTEMNFMFVS